LPLPARAPANAITSAVLLSSTVAKRAALSMLQPEHLQLVILKRTAPIQGEHRRTV